MKLATVRRPNGTTVAVRIDGDFATELPVSDVGEVLRGTGIAGAADAQGSTLPTPSLDYAPLIARPGKIICVGLNYRTHIIEMKRELPEYPVLFAKFAECLIGAGDDIVLPPDSDAVDWEGELAVVIGTRVRRGTQEQAGAAIAGYSISNDVSMRDWQFRTREWLQGKTWADSTPLGPVLATPEEVPAKAFLRTVVDGVEKQRGDIHDLVHGPTQLVEYISAMLPLNPGDVILTGTPGGVGHARNPPEFLKPGQTVTVSIDGIGALSNRTVAEATASRIPSGLAAASGLGVGAA